MQQYNRPVKWHVQAAGRLDVFVRQMLPQVSRQDILQAIERGDVRVNGRPAKKGQSLHPGDQVECLAPLRGPVPPAPEPEVPLEVLYSDLDYVVVNKAPGLATHPLRLGEGGTVANAVVARFPETASASEDPREGGACHRLDIFTSGALAFARGSTAWASMRMAFSQRRVEKQYLAVVEGRLLGAGVIDEALSQSGKTAHVDSSDGLPATTEYRALGHGPRHTLVLCTARTGRMHQIRAHLAHLGHPLQGDALYGADSAEGHFLHASLLRWDAFTVTAPLPAHRMEELATWGLLECYQAAVNHQE